MTIFITWPTHYSEYKSPKHSTNYQHAWWLYHGLRARHEDVRFIPWDHVPDYPIPEGSRLYSHSSWPIGTGGLKFPRRVKERGGEVYLITNCPLFDYVVHGSMYDLHGFKGFDNDGMNFDPQLPSSYAAQQLAELKQADVMFCHTSTVGLDLWNGVRPGGAKRRAFVAGHRFVPFLSPIDKEAFHREVFGPYRTKFLIPNGHSHRKRQQDFRRLCGGRYIDFPTVDWSWFEPHTYRDILGQCSFIASNSLQEGSPYWIAEGMSKGLLALGAEDWYDGWGYEELIWRQAADGSRDRENQNKVEFLCSSDPKVKQIYDDVQHRFRARREDTWDWVLDNLFCKPKSELPIA